MATKKKAISPVVYKASSLDEAKTKPSKIRPTGILPLDIATGIGGWRSSMFVEIFGPESSGKTLITLLSAIYAQKNNEPSLLIDGEFVWDPQDKDKMSYQVEWFKKLGGNPDLLDIYWPEYSEKTYDAIVHEFLPSNKYAYIIIDSWKSMTPKAKLSGDVGDKSIGAFGEAARVNAEFIAQALPVLFHKTDTTILVVNHESIDPTVRWGDPRTTPGGRALKFYAKQRVQLGSPKDKSEEKAIIHGIFKKNKIASPYRLFQFPINFTKGFDEVDLLCRLAYEHNIITGGAGGVYYYNDLKITGGKANLTKEFESDPILLDDLRTRVKEKYVVQTEVVPDGN